MPPPYTLFGRTLRALGNLSPNLSGRLALRAFFVTTPRAPVRDADVDTHHAALRTRLDVRGHELVAYEWGTGRDTVLILHGWRGRASQLAPLVRELVAEGFRVVSFDAPAHGGSPGRRADIRDWVAAVEALDRLHGPFRAIVGHSLGALAALTAARTSVRTGRVAVVSGAGGPDAFLTEFARELLLDHATRAQLEARFHERLGENQDSTAARYDAVAHPLPAGTELLVVHDRGDRRMPDHDARRLHDAHVGRSAMVRTSGSGHTSILSSDVALDALTAFVRGGLAAVDDLDADVLAHAAGP
ncbi:alpha/beta fold hydrolase [Oerskovia sp. NPDC056781]|uniref:alpha/beta fold hydrolase n=1 Tax=Oerskovia sp. NPDC056781 TaxID=3345942 RepID=UPI00366DA45F